VVSRPSPTLANAVEPGVRVHRIEPLQRRVDRNRGRFVAFMIAFTTVTGLAIFVGVGVVAAAVGFILVGTVPVLSSATGLTESGTLIAIFGGLLLLSLAGAWTWSLVRLSRSETMLLERLDARMPKAGTLLPTKSVLRDVTLAAGLPKTPQFYVIDTPKVNAFVLGRTPERIRVGVTRGLLERIGVDEQRAVFANLIARVLSLDTLWATATSVLMGPIWAMRDYDLRYEPARRGVTEGTIQEQDRSEDWRASMFVFYGIAVVVTELLAWYHQEAAWTAAEKADAEGILLLKDPRSMLRAIENVLHRDNCVPTAGDAYSQLFYCWAGFGFAPEDDPEMRRVARLRETLGAEGAAYVPRPNVPSWPAAPPAPRLELQEELSQGGGI